MSADSDAVFSFKMMLGSPVLKSFVPYHSSIYNDCARDMDFDNNFEIDVGDLATVAAMRAQWKWNFGDNNL
jgi:hypothetical protein